MPALQKQIVREQHHASRGRRGGNIEHGNGMESQAMCTCSAVLHDRQEGKGMERGWGVREGKKE